MKKGKPKEQPKQIEIIDVFGRQYERTGLASPFNLVICTPMQDGENYFHGVCEKKLPNKFGGYMPMLVNLWTPYFEDLKRGAGIYNREQADFYVKMLATEGVSIRTWAEENARREAPAKN